MVVQPGHRKSMKRREFPAGVRFVTFSCQGRLPLLRHPGICRTLVEAIEHARSRFNFELFAWVIMPEHVHMLMRMPDAASLDRALLAIKLSTAKKVLHRWSEIDAPILGRLASSDGAPRFWLAGGGFDRHVRSNEEFLGEMRYVHNNPVERGLAAHPLDWPWSSARWWAGSTNARPACDPLPGRLDGVEFTELHDRATDLSGFAEKSVPDW